MDLGGIDKHWDRGDGSYFIITLHGKIKVEQTDVGHKNPGVNVTNLGIQVKLIVDRRRKAKAEAHLYDGPAISDIKGKLLTAKDLDEMIIKILNELFITNQELFPADITDKKQLPQHFQCFRTFRKTSDTRAIEAEVSREDINTVNRWRETERANGKRPNRTMMQHYAEFDILLMPFKRYTQAM